MSAAAAAQRRASGPHRLVTWLHATTGESLAVEVPLSVFHKQQGGVFRKWQQRAWRALYTLRCHLGEEVWPEGCRAAAAAGAPCWDDLAEEAAALAKLPFCMPQKVGKPHRRGRAAGLACHRAKTAAHARQMQERAPASGPRPGLAVLPCTAASQTPVYLPELSRSPGDS